MKEIALKGKYGEGKVAKVSDEDYELLSKYNWHVDTSGYAVVRIKMHQIVTDRNGEHREGLVVDHFNGDRLDNRWENLRVVTHQQNSMNARQVRLDI